MNILIEKILKQRAKKVKRRIGVVNLSTAKNALIVYDSNEVGREQKVRDFARFLIEEGIKTDTIGFYKKKNKEDKLPADELGYAYFDKKSVDIFGFPVEKKLKKIISKEYNLLIDLNLEGRFSLRVISSLSKANFKVGKAGSYQNDVCDLTIATGENDLDYLIEQIKKYLNTINSK